MELYFNHIKVLYKFYFRVQNDLAKEATTLLKQLYDTTKSNENKTNASEDDALPELIVNDFDEEQIWQELELQNSARLKQLSNTIQKLSTSDLVLFKTSNGTIYFNIRDFCFFFNEFHFIIIKLNKVKYYKYSSFYYHYYFSI